MTSTVTADTGVISHGDKTSFCDFLPGLHRGVTASVLGDSLDASLLL